MKTQYSIRFIILIFLSLIQNIGLIVFSIVIFKISIPNVDLMGFIIGSVFLWLGIGNLYIVLISVKLIEINNDNIIIKNPFLFKKYETELSLIKYLEFEEQLTWNTRKGILISLNNGDVVQIKIKEYKNSYEFIKLISDSCKRDETIKQKIWIKGLKFFLFFGLIILIGLLIVKIITK